VKDAASLREPMVTQEQLVESIRRTLKLARLEPSAKMGSVRGWDSLRHVHLLLELEKTFELEIPPDLFGTLTSVESIVSHFRSNGHIVD
jgi:acyl carrier protein